MYICIVYLLWVYSGVVWPEKHMGSDNKKYVVWSLYKCRCSKLSERKKTEFQPYKTMQYWLILNQSQINATFRETEVFKAMYKYAVACFMMID